MTGQQCAPYLQSAVSKFEERRGDLANRQKYLREKITNMEKSIPALMAFNMWTSGQNTDDAPLTKIKQIMKKLSPHPDPAEKLVEELKNVVKNLNDETDKLHGKILEAEVEIEESEMELESLELANEELEERLKSLENELKGNRTLSLHSIHSDDLVCLTKIRQLGEERVELKKNIKELEEREAMFREQIERILTTRDVEKGCGCKRMAKNNQALECNERKIQCAVHSQAYNIQQGKKKKPMQKKQEAGSKKDSEKPIPIDVKGKTEKEINSVKPTDLSSFDQDNDMSEICTCQSPTMMACYGLSTRPATSKNLCKLHSSSKTLPFCTGGCSKHLQRFQVPVRCIRPCCFPIIAHGPPCCKTAATVIKSSCKPAPCNPSPVFKSTLCKENPHTLHGITTKCTSITNPPMSAKKILALKDTPGYRCSCRAKVSRDQFDFPCSCVADLISDDEKEQQPTDGSVKINEHSSTDEEYCECCDCGDNGSDLSDSYQHKKS